MMKWKKTTFLLLMSAVFMISAVTVVQAATDHIPPAAPGLTNPIQYDSAEQFILAIVAGVVQIGVYIVIIAIIYSGFLFVSARGKPEGLKKAKEAFLYTVIGAAILLGATLLANVIEGTVNTIRVDASTHIIS